MKAEGVHEGSRVVSAISKNIPLCLGDPFYGYTRENRQFVDG
jgi:hypothetical protein